MKNLDDLPIYGKKDLEIGDILIFEYPNFDPKEVWDIWHNKKYKTFNERAMAVAWYMIHFAIPWCDPGDDPKNYKNIYHAAIWGNVDIFRGSTQEPNFQDRIMQAGTKGTMQASLEETMEEPSVLNVYVCRHKDKGSYPDFEKRINDQIREYYNNTSLKYSFETAWMLSVLCSLRYEDGTLHKLIRDRVEEPLATIIALSIYTLVEYYAKHHQDEMIACSPLVADIYHDANIELKTDPLRMAGGEGGSLSLSDLNLEALELGGEVDINMPMKADNDTIVTPRQLMESDSVDVKGYIPHTW